MTQKTPSLHGDPSLKPPRLPWGHRSQWQAGNEEYWPNKKQNQEISQKPTFWQSNFPGLNHYNLKYFCRNKIY